MLLNLQFSRQLCRPTTGENTARLVACHVQDIPDTDNT